MQIIHFILDKILKLSTYYMPFYRQSLQSYAISKTVQFFGPPCIKKFFCLRLSLCLLVSWAWLDRPLTWLTNHRPSVLWQCWLGHLTCKIVSETTYNGYPWDVKPYCTYHTYLTQLLCSVSWKWSDYITDSICHVITAQTRCSNVNI